MVHAPWGPTTPADSGTRWQMPASTASPLVWQPFIHSISYIYYFMARTGATQMNSSHNGVPERIILCYKFVGYVDVAHTV